MGSNRFDERAPEAVAVTERPSSTRRDRQPIPVQAKLEVGASDDPFEREADHIADQVMVALRDPEASGADAVHVPAAGRISRVSRAAAVVGAEGGDLDQHTEAAITGARGGGQAMEPTLRRNMEGAFGADFSNIRIHVGAQSDALNDRIQARAFTTGSDVFIRRQDYAPDSDAGQRLIAHELTHTIQQGGARAIGPAGAAQRCVQRSSGTIQRRWGSASKTNAQKGKNKGALPAEDDIGSTIDTVGLVPGALGSTMVNDVDGYKDDIAKARTGDKDATGTGKSGATDRESQQLGVVGGVADMAGMFVGIAKSIDGFRKGKTKGDKAGALLEGGTAITGGAKGLSSLIKSGSELDGHKDGIGKSKEAAGALGGIADGFGAIKDTFFAIKKIVDLASDAAGMTDDEKFRASMDIIKTAMEAAKGGVSAAKSFLDLCNSGVSEAMVNAVPGLGIAIGCVELIVRGYDLVTSLIQSSVMRTSKQAAKTKMGGTKGKSSEQQAKAVLANSASTPEDRAAAEEYLTAKGLQYLNDKRTRRALLKIGVAMTKIAGDAATLGGASAGVGIGLKVGAAVLDLGATAFRKFKQWARDKVDEKAAPDSFLRKVFNTDKTSAKKLAEYNRMIDNILDMIIKATPTDPTNPTDTETKRMEVVEGYVIAMGFSMMALNREAMADGDGTNLREKMLEAMKKRE